MICYDRIKQNVQQEELFWGLGRLCVTLHRPAESLELLTGGGRLKFTSGAERLSLKGPRGRSGGRSSERQAGRH